MGFSTTVEYVAAAAAAVLRETGLLPHINAGEHGSRAAGSLLDHPGAAEPAPTMELGSHTC